LLNSEILRSKIAFHIDEHIEEKEFIVELRRDAEKPLSYYPGTSQITLEHDNLPRTSCFLRMVLEANGVGYSCLPLHAACIQSKSSSVILTAESGKGKSLISNSYLGHGYEVIGDDHIIIKDGQVTGNSLSRIRARDGSSQYRELNSETCLLKPYRIVMVDVTVGDSYSELSKIQAASDAALRNQFLSYLNGGTYYLGAYHTPTEIFGGDIINKHLSDYSSFINGSESVIKVGGSCSFIRKFVDEVL
jgi:hypothetical protein